MIITFIAAIIGFAVICNSARDLVLSRINKKVRNPSQEEPEPEDANQPNKVVNETKEEEERAPAPRASAEVILLRATQDHLHKLLEEREVA